jgi:hypothetical protein
LENYHINSSLAILVENDAIKAKGFPSAKDVREL